VRDTTPIHSPEGNKTHHTRTEYENRRDKPRIRRRTSENSHRPDSTGDGIYPITHSLMLCTKTIAAVEEFLRLESKKNRPPEVEIALLDIIHELRMKRNDIECCNEALEKSIQTVWGKEVLTNNPNNP